MLRPEEKYSLHTVNIDHKERSENKSVRFGYPEMAMGTRCLHLLLPLENLKVTARAKQSNRPRKIHLCLSVMPFRGLRNFKACR